MIKCKIGKNEKMYPVVNATVAVADLY